MNNARRARLSARQRRLLQGGAASIEYAVVTIVTVCTLLFFSDSDGTVKNTLLALAKAVVDFYADYSSAISLATP